MYLLVKNLFSLLTPYQRRRFYVLQILVVIMAFAEIVGIASIVPFMALMGDISLLQGKNIYASLYAATGITDPHNFLFLAGLTVLIALTIGAAISTFTIWRLALFGTKVGAEIADRLYRHYMQQNWLFHANSSSAQLTKQITAESGRVTGQIIQPLLQMNARIVLTLFIVMGIFLYNPWVAITGLVIFTGAYLVLYKVVRTRLQKNGQKISHLTTIRFRLMNEGFGGIKDIILLGRRDDLIQRFEQSGLAISYAQGTNTALGQVPRYFMELLAFGSIISLILFLIKTEQGNLGAILPTLSVYALAGFKLLPSLQQIYSSTASIKSAQSAFEAIRQDLIESGSQPPAEPEMHSLRLAPTRSITLQDVTFTYPGKANPALKELYFDIPANRTIGIVGPSGSGKSTAIDMLLGLINPQQGKLLIDDVEITLNNLRSWQDGIGFVPQSIFLSEGSIAENVAFGVPTQQIDRAQVKKSLDLAHLDELIQDLPEGIDSKVGERGIQLSGGQRQRIGIARALYNDASVLVFDEATSALDGITEKIIMDAIHDFSGQKTIIMVAHRLKTVQKCDVIFYLKNGRVTDAGTYQELMDKNPEFRKMAEHS